jgi:hypothetical protein
MNPRSGIAQSTCTHSLPQFCSGATSHTKGKKNARFTLTALKAKCSQL